ncbi:MAG: hypothetical protein RLZZ399_791 [Verrucomicrobiota bacterium]|jgi:outer membrane protein assembly factor BamB
MKSCSLLNFPLPRALGCAVALLASCATTPAADWLHYRGPTQNGVSDEVDWAVPRDTAPTLWRAQVGIGTSSVTVSGGRLFTQGHEGDSEIIRCLDASTGRELWRHQHKVSLDPNLFEGGSRSTPTLFEGKVYTLSHEGHLLCFDGLQGRLIWQKHLPREFGGRKPEWGYSGAPLVWDNRLLVDCGGEGSSTLALHPKTGEILWRSGSDKPGYAAPCVLPLEGRQILLIFKADHLVAYDPATGAEQWRYPWKTSYDINAATPLLVGPNRVLISSGYNAGAAVLEIQGGQPRLLWQNKALRAHINSPTLAQGAVFGIDGNTGGGNLVCLHPETGVKRWEEKSVKGGALITAAGKLLIVSEKGDFVAAEAHPDGFRPLHRQIALTRRTWAQPTLSEGRLYLRDNLGELLCLDLRPK